MQRITLVCLGKLNQKFYADGVQEYQKRLRPYCRFEVVELAEEAVDEKNASPATIQTVLEKEAVRIMAAVPKGARLVPLCVEGKQVSSEEFSVMLENSALEGNGDIAFIIGSSHGIAESIKRTAYYKLSLSKFTLPHQLARLVLAEQVYRAFMIRNGSKYHK